MSIEALKLALEALETCNWVDDGGYGHAEYDHVSTSKAIAAIREALAQPEQEPVAWSYWQSCLNEDGTQTAPWVHRLSKFQPSESIINKDITPLYTTPQPQREWVELTDEEIRELEKQFEAERVRTSDEEYLVIYPSAYWQWQRAIEAKLKEKNT